jgi:hypothetical protein
MTGSPRRITPAERSMTMCRNSRKPCPIKVHKCRRSSGAGSRPADRHCVSAWR